MWDRGRGFPHTLLLKLLQELVVCPSQPGPFRKLILAARRIQLPPAAEVFLLQRAMLGLFSRERCGNRAEQTP